MKPKHIPIRFELVAMTNIPIRVRKPVRALVPTWFPTGWSKLMQKIHRMGS